MLLYFGVMTTMMTVSLTVELSRDSYESNRELTLKIGNAEVHTWGVSAYEWDREDIEEFLAEKLGELFRAKESADLAEAAAEHRRMSGWDA